jgi:hypothetical protein
MDHSVGWPPTIPWSGVRGRRIAEESGTAGAKVGEGITGVRGRGGDQCVRHGVTLISLASLGECLDGVHLTWASQG